MVTEVLILIFCVNEKTTQSHNEDVCICFLSTSLIMWVCVGLMGFLPSLYLMYTGRLQKELLCLLIGWWYQCCCSSLTWSPLMHLLNHVSLHYTRMRMNRANSYSCIAALCIYIHMCLYIPRALCIYIHTVWYYIYVFKYSEKQMNLMPKKDRKAAVGSTGE